MNYKIENSALNITISTNGAEAISVKYLGEEKLWQNQNWLWQGHAPVLFPFAGHVETVIDGKLYPFVNHGFSRKFSYEVIKKSSDEIILKLNSSEETKKFYPFDFEFSVGYKVCDNSLFITYSLFNASNKSLYASFGAHDSFMLNEDIDNFYLEFDKEEDFKLFNHTEDGFLLNEYKSYGKGKTFPISEKFLYDSKTMIFGEINSRKVSVVRKDGTKFYELEFKDFPNLCVWRPGDAKMVCVEPWKNMPDVKENKFKEFKDKKGVICLEPNNYFETTRRITYF